MENILVTKCKPFIAKAWKLCHECVSVMLNALPQTGLLCHVYDISHHTIYYIPLNFKIKIAKEVSKRYFKMNRPIAKLYWSNSLKNSFSFTKYIEWYIAIIQTLWHSLTSLFQFLGLLFFMACQYGLWHQIVAKYFFLVVKMFFCHKEDTHKEGMSKDLTKLVWCTFNFAP